MSNTAKTRLTFSSGERELLSLLLKEEGISVRQEQRIPQRERFNFVPLSFLQETLWFVDQLNPGDHSYNVPLALRLEGDLNVEALRKAVEFLVARHEVLRTTFPSVNGEPVQVIAPEMSVALEVTDLRTLPAKEREARTESLIERELRWSFDLARGPLFRAGLLRLSDEEHVMLLNMHHIVSDGWSIGVLFRELAEIYEAFSMGRPSSLKELTIQYADYAVWQREGLKGEVIEEQLSYWKSQLSGAPAVLELPTGRPRPAVQSFRGDREFGVLPKDLLEEIKGLSRREGVTLFMTLVAAFQILLQRYTNQNDIVVGTDVANRSQIETEDLVGFFVNNVALRSDLSGDPTFRGLLARVREAALGAYAHQETPLNKVVEAVNPARDASYSPIFQVLFVLQNAPVSNLKLPGLKVSSIEVNSKTSKFDLAVFMEETEEGLRGVWGYRTDLFDPATVSRMSHHYETLLRSIVAQPELRLSALEILTETERRQQEMEKRERKESRLKRFMNVAPKAVDLQEEFVSSSYLQPGQTFPLVIQPKMKDVNLVDWAENNRDLLGAEVSKHGAILFRGFNVAKVSDFEQFAQAICPELFGEYGDLPREGVGGKVYGSTPYPSDQAILFHNESSHMHRWPMKIWFYCVRAAQQGGETPIVDCRRIYELLEPDLRERFLQKGLMYVRNYTDGLDVDWRSFFHTTERAVVEEHCRKVGLEFEWRDGDGLRTRQVCLAIARHPKTGEMVFFNQIQLHHVSCLDEVVRESLSSIFREQDLPRNVYYGDGSPIEDSVVDKLSEIYRKATVSFPWQEGDVMMLDNMLIAHGRNPFVGERKIVVTLGEMVNKDDIRVTPNGAAQ